MQVLTSYKIFILLLFFALIIIWNILNYVHSFEKHYLRLSDIRQFTASSSILSESLHLISLNSICVSTKGDSRREPIIPWNYDIDSNSEARLVYRNDPYLYTTLRQCPDIDVYIPRGLRNHGYCEDAMGFVKYLKSRGLPEWIFDEELGVYENKTFNYFNLCPNTPVLFFNHYWDGGPQKLAWPVNKPIYMMPNIEMNELRASHLWNANVILCRTKDCEYRIRNWFKQLGNPRGILVFYSGGVTSDPTIISTLDEEKKLKKDYQNITFLHTPGTSSQKGTKELFECWKSSPHFPPLYVHAFSKEIKEHYENVFNNNTPKNVILSMAEMNSSEFGSLLDNATAIICPSIKEGFGHYINQARAANTLVITTNAAPMNELINDSSGVLVDVKEYSSDNLQLLGPKFNGEFGLVDAPPIRAIVSSKNICLAVEKVLKMTSEERKELAKQARNRYEMDVAFFQHRMKDLIHYQKEINNAIKAIN